MIGLQALLADDDDLTWFDVPEVRRADQIHRARLGADHPRSRPAGRCASGRNPCGSRAPISRSFVIIDERIGAANLRQCVDDRGLGAIFSRPRKKMDDDFGVGAWPGRSRQAGRAASRSSVAFTMFPLCPTAN